MSQTFVRVVRGSGREASTRAAAEFVSPVRLRMQVELERYGERVKDMPSYRQLDASISRESLRATWPDADIDALIDQ